MWDLATIKSINSRPAKVEDTFNRHCSFSGTAEDGIVLHSAKQRNTVYLQGNREWAPRRSVAPAASFMSRWFSVNSAEARDRLVESYFNCAADL